MGNNSDGEERTVGVGAGIFRTGDVPSHGEREKVARAAITGSCGAMDNASDYGSEDSRFESWQDRWFCLCLCVYGGGGTTYERHKNKP